MSRTSKLSYANVVSTLALVIAMGSGTAYAANEWTGANIRNGTLTGADVKNSSLTGADVKNGSLTQWDVKDGSLVGKDLLDGTVAAADIADGSITSAEVKDGALTGSDVADNSITSADVAPLNGDLDILDNTITTFDLADNSVDADEVLDFGLTNEDIGVLFAQVASDGTLSSSSGGATASRIGLGQYAVDFGRDVHACAFLATQGEAGAGGAAGAMLGATDRSANVEAAFVTVRDADGAFVDRAFTIVVVC
jgi:hypothetical protein